MKKTILITSSLLISSMMLKANPNQIQKKFEVYKESKSIEAFEINSFCKAIIQGDLDLVKAMIAQGENINQKSLGKTPAHYAARYNKPEILKVLIQHGANLRKRCDQGYTVKKYAELAQAEEALNVINLAMKK